MGTLGTLFKSKRLFHFNVYFLSTAIQKASAIFLLPIYTRYLTTDQYGLWAVCQTIPSIAVVFFYVAIQDTIYFTAVKKNSDMEQMISTGIIFQTVLFVSLSIALLSISPFFRNAVFFHVPYYPYIFVSLLSSIVMIFSITYFYYLQANERSVLYSILNLLQFICFIGTMLYSLIILRLGPLSGIMAFLISQSLVSAIGIIHLYARFGFHFSGRHLKKMLAFSIPLVPQNLSFWAKDTIDRILLVGISQLHNAGIYQIAISYGGMLGFGVQAFSTVNTPRFFTLIKDEIKNRNAIVSIMPVSAAFFSIVALGMSLFASEIIQMLTAKSYHEAALYVPVVTTAFVIYLIYTNVINILYHRSATKLIAATSMAACTISGILSFFLVKWFAVMGAAFSLLLSNLIFSAAFYLSARHTYRIKWPLAKTIIISFMPLSSFPVLYCISNVTFPMEVLIKSLIIILYGAFCYFLLKKELRFLNSGLLEGSCR